MPGRRPFAAIAAAFSCLAIGIHAEAAKADDIFAIELPDVRNYAALTVGLVPDYLGSDDNVVGVAPAALVRFGRSERHIRLLATELSVNLWDNEAWSAGPVLNYRFGRDDEVDDVAVSRMREIDDAVEVGGFIGWKMVHPSDPRYRISTELKVTSDVSDAHDGILASVSARYFRPVGRAVILSLGAGITYGDDEYTSTYFGVDANNAARSGLPAYTAGAGLRDFRISPMALFSFSEHWHVAAGFIYSRLLGDAADSPIVSQRGSENQLYTGIALAYSW